VRSVVQTGAAVPVAMRDSELWNEAGYARSSAQYAGKGNS
jgi:hypothetical protein